jgi:hypothetical protein
MMRARVRRQQKTKWPLIMWFAARWKRAVFQRPREPISGLRFEGPGQLERAVGWGTCFLRSGRFMVGGAVFVHGWGREAIWEVGGWSGVIVVAIVVWAVTWSANFVCL